MQWLILTYVLTYGGAVASLFKPYHGFLVYVCFGILKPEASWSWAVPQGNYSRIVAIALLIGWAIGGFGDWKLGRAWPIVVAYIASWSWSVLCMVNCHDSDVGWRYVEGQAKILLPFLVGITVIDSTAKLKQLAWVIAMTLGYLAYEVNLSYLNGFNQIRDGRVASLQGGSAGLMMVCGMAVTFFLGLYSDKWWQKALTFPLAAGMAHAILLTFSRGSMISAMITATAIGLVLIVQRQSKYLAVLAAATFLVLCFTGPELAARLETTVIVHPDGRQEASAQSRLDLWRDCWDVMLKNPIFGVGPCYWPVIAFLQYGWPLGKEAHSLWFQTAAEQGIPGVLFLGLFYGYSLVRLGVLICDRNSHGGQDCRNYAGMAAAGIVGYVVSSTFISTSGLEIAYYTVLIGAGALKLSSQEGFGEVAADETMSDSYVDAEGP